MVVGFTYFVVIIHMLEAAWDEGSALKIHYRMIILEGKSLLLAQFWHFVGQCGQLLWLPT